MIGWWVLLGVIYLGQFSIGKKHSMTMMTKNIFAQLTKNIFAQLTKNIFAQLTNWKLPAGEVGEYCSLFCPEENGVSFSAKCTHGKGEQIREGVKKRGGGKFFLLPNLPPPGFGLFSGKN